MYPRVLVAAVPDRRLANCIRTASCKSDKCPLRPNTAPNNSISPVRSREAENSGTLTGWKACARPAETFCCSSMGLTRHRVAPFLCGMLDYDHTAIGSRDCARNQNRIVVGQNLDDFEIDNGCELIAHLSRHPQTLANPARIRAVANRTTVAEVFV